MERRRAEQEREQRTLEETERQRRQEWMNVTMERQERERKRKEEEQQMLIIKEQENKKLLQETKIQEQERVKLQQDRKTAEAQKLQQQQQHEKQQQKLLQQQHQQAVRQVYESQKWNERMQSLATEEETRLKEEQAQRMRQRPKERNVEVQHNQIITVADVHVNASHDKTKRQSSVVPKPPVPTMEEQRRKVQALYGNRSTDVQVQAVVPANRQGPKLSLVENEFLPQQHAHHEEGQEDDPKYRLRRNSKFAGVGPPPEEEYANVMVDEMLQRLGHFGPGVKSSGGESSGIQMHSGKKVGDYAHEQQPYQGTSKEPKNQKERKKAELGQATGPYTEAHVSTCDSVAMVRGIIGGESTAM